jgi:hypothetical protein
MTFRKNIAPPSSASKDRAHKPPILNLQIELIVKGKKLK